MLRPLAFLRALCFAGIPLLVASMTAATPSSQDQPQDQQQYPQQDQQQDQNGAYENFSPEQLENLLSPIALYPDPLLAQVFVAATFPDQVEEAARYVRAYGQNGIDEQNWDVSVKAVAHYPTVIEMMADKIDWTTSIGQAYVNQSTDVANAVQHLRHLARSQGNLVSTPQEEVLEHDDYIAITPYQPALIYVPVYDPAIIYFRRPYWGPAITFGVGFPIGAWLNLDFRWGFGGGWGGVYYTGWRREGWGGGCWNCGWIGRCRDRVDIRNNVYINNRYERVNINRTVVNRTVNVNNINRYNSVHRNVSYNNIQHNNERVNRVNNSAGNNGRGGNFAGNNGRPGNVSNRNDRPGNSAVSNNRAGVNNKIIDRNIDRNNPRIDQYRGRDTSVRNDRPPSAQPQQRGTPENRQQTRPVQQQQRPQTRSAPQPAARQAPQPAARPAPHSFARNEGNFDPRQSSQRGQASRQQAAPPRAASRPAPQPRPQQQSRPAPAQHSGGGGERRKP